MARPWVVHLIGHPGVGKLTIARALARVAEEEGEAAVVVDNDPEGVRRFVAERRVLRPDTDHVLDLDVTALGPDDAARIIWRHATAAARSGGEDQAVARGATEAAPSRRNPS